MSNMTTSEELDELRYVFQQIVMLDLNSASVDILQRIGELCPTVEDWKRVLSAIPLDKLSFQLNVGVQRVDIIEVLSRWCLGFGAGSRGGYTNSQAETYGYLTVLLVTLLTMDGGMRSLHDCDRLCRVLVRDPVVRSALISLYASAGESSMQSIQEWERIQESVLEFHRHGSTSFILCGLPSQSSGRRIKFALKCVLFPYATIPVIASTTKTYAADHNSLDAGGRSVGHMVQVWASTSHWILMDFAEGTTLAEEIERLKDNLAVPVVAWGRRRVTSPVGNVRLDLIRKLGLPILAALSELRAYGKIHEDLSPTNIIVRQRDRSDSGSDYEVTFIDFGRNYLYTGAIGGLDSLETAFVAPEVRENLDDAAKADLYSVGYILIALGNVGENRDGTIPDRFYGQAPLIARLIEDLIDRRPSHRLLVFNLESANVYRDLKRILEQELDVTQSELVDDLELRDRAIPYDRQSVFSVFTSIFPLSREPRKRRRIYRIRRAQGVLGDSRRSMHARWLLPFSVLASASYFVATLVCIFWIFRDIGIDILNPASQAVLRAFGANPNAIPFVDSLRQSDYRLGEVWNNLPARLVGLSFALAGARHYQNILGGLTTRVSRTRARSGAALDVSTEIAIRVIAVWPAILILTANLVQVRWWPLGTAIGYTGVLVATLLSARYATKYLDLARRQNLSTVPPAHQKVVGLDSYRQWGPSMAFYALTVWLFAIFLYVGVLKDVYVYAVAVILVNVGLFYIIKTGANALDVRAGLNRCFLAAERLRYGAESTVRGSL
jgi:serine/threonine protein kinase